MAMVDLPTGKPQRAVFDVLVRDGGWWSPYEVQREIVAGGGDFYSDATVTAKLRDLRKAAHGGHRVDKRRRERGRGFEYRLVRGAEQLMFEGVAAGAVG